MVILPRGVTGFDVPEGQPTPDSKVFLGDCWHVAIASRGRVDDLPPVPAWWVANFVAHLLVLPDGAVTALLNRVHPWVGFCRPMGPGSGLLEFTEPGHVGAALGELGRYRVLTHAKLEQPVGASMCAELGRGESAQLKYWAKAAGPGKLRVGDVVFNFWD